MISVYVFQSTHPRGVRLDPRRNTLAPCLSFNPRTHEGCDCDFPKNRRKQKSFNPRTHEGCDVTEPRSSMRRGYVSIHAPTRGATAFWRNCDKTAGFQSTHPRGVRLRKDVWLCSSLCSFNPRTHEGCDRFLNLKRLILSKFQSTHPRGVRRLQILISFCLFMFQSTHPRGVRLVLTIKTLRLFCFNPRTHEGCDCSVVGSESSTVVSIHAPTRGATSYQYISFFRLFVSIHAPTRGATV